MKAKNYQNNMCIVKYKKVKSTHYGVGKCINYVTNPEKTMEGSLDMEFALNYVGNEDKVVEGRNGRRLVSGHNCNDMNAIFEFNELEKNYHKNKAEYLNKGHTANNAFHIIISYKGSEIDPEEVHEMGKEFAERLCGDEFMALTATHLNTDNYHNHIVVCAYGLDGMHKLQDTKDVYKLFKEIAYEISLEHGLPIMAEEEEEKKLSKAEKERRKDITKKVEELRKQYPDHTRYRSVYVSAYDEYGRHRGGLERMLLTVKEMMKQAEEAAYKDALRELDEENIFFKPVSERVKLVDEATEICRKYDIGSMEELNEKLRQLHAENSPYKQRIRSLTTYLSNAEKFEDGARNMTEAQLNPMQPKTKSDLFRAVHDTEYRLIRKFVELSEDEGRAIVKAIESGMTDNLPDGVMFGRVYYGVDCGENVARSEEEFARILDSKRQELKHILERQKPVKEQISELYKVKLNIEKYLRPEFVFGPLFVGNTGALEKAKKEILTEKRTAEKGNRNILKNNHITV